MAKNNLSSVLEGIKKRMEEIEKNEGFKLIEDESKVTNKVILSYDIVGVITASDDGIPAVNVIKNDMNNVTGIIPFSLWLSLIEDKIAINEKQHISQEKDIVPDFDEVFTDLSKAFSKTFDDVLSNAGETVDKIRPEASDFKDDISSVYDTLTDVLGDFVKNISEMVEPTIDEAAVKVKIAKLETLRDEAIIEGVSTKKFIRKINSKIKELSTKLGD